MELFAAKYLSHWLRHPVPPFHRELYTLAISSYRRIVIAAPRSFAKSTVFSLISVLYELFLGTASKIFLVSATGTLAQQWVRIIKNELEGNRSLIADFGSPDTTRKWTEDHIIHSRNVNDPVEVVAKGAGFQLRGFRPDLMIVDDIETDDGVRSDVQRQKLKEWFNSALINTLETTSRLRMVGTNMHPLSLLNDVMNREAWLTRKYQAYTDDPIRQTSLWPEKWPVEALKEREQEIGTRAFNAEFMNNPMTSDNPTFITDWFRYYDPDDQDVQNDFYNRTRTIVACDPAISRNDRNDYTAIVTITSTQRGKDYTYYVREIKRGRWPVNQTINYLINAYDRFQAAAILIETVAFQQVVADELHRHCDDNFRAINVIEIKPDRDKERRAEAIAPELERGRVHFIKDTQIPLLEELQLFPTGEHDDLVDAFVYAIAELKAMKAETEVMVTSALNEAQW